MRAPRLLVIASILLGLALGAGAQSNSAIDELLAERQASFGRAAYMVLAARELLPEDATPEQAVQALAGLGWKLRVRAAAEPLTLGEYCRLVMIALQIKGGLMYRLLPGPRYAARELAYLGFIKGDRSPYRSLSGEEALRILQAALEWKGGRS
jgi:hypothetical protein